MMIYCNLFMNVIGYTVVLKNKEWQSEQKSLTTNNIMPETLQCGSQTEDYKKRRCITSVTVIKILSVLAIRLV